MYIPYTGIHIIMNTSTFWGWERGRGAILFFCIKKKKQRSYFKKKHTHTTHKHLQVPLFLLLLPCKEFNVTPRPGVIMFTWKKCQISYPHTTTPPHKKFSSIQIRVGGRGRRGASCREAKKSDWKKKNSCWVFTQMRPSTAAMTLVVM